MDRKERFKRIREVERQMEKLVDKGWTVPRIEYDDETGHDFQVRIVLTIDSKDEIGII